MDPSVASRYQSELNGELAIVQSTTRSLGGLLGQRGKLLAQLQENEMVAKELSVLSGSSDPVLFKLVGPVLVKQEFDEAKMNVNNRIKFFKSEIERSEKQQKELETQRATAQEKIMKIQESVRKIQQEIVQKQMNQGKQ